MSVFVIKLIALVFMAFDHIAAAFGTFGWDLLPFGSELIRAVGRLSFPVFAWCIVSGWQHTRSRMGYFCNLCLFAVLSQIPFTLALNTANLMAGGQAQSAIQITPIVLFIGLFCLVTLWYFGMERKFTPKLLLPAAAYFLPAVMCKVGKIWVLTNELNVLYTLALGLVFLYPIEKLRQRTLKPWESFWLLWAVFLAFLAYGIYADYGYNMMGISLILALYAARKRKEAQALVILGWGVLYYGILLGNGLNAAATVLAALLVFAYNGKKGPGAKWLFYWFYPAHLLVIGLVNACLKYGIW